MALLCLFVSTNAISQNLVDEDYYAFDAPFIIGEDPFYWTQGAGFSIVEGEGVDGSKCLKYTQAGSISANSAAHSVKNSIAISEGGKFTLSLKVKLEENSTLESLQINLREPYLQIPKFDLTNVAKGEWVELTQTFTREASNVEDYMTILVEQAMAGDGPTTLYIDDIVIAAALPDDNLIDTDLHGFETVAGLKWTIQAAGQPYLSIGSEKVSSGSSALKFSNTSDLTATAPMYSTAGSLNFGTGNFELTAKVWKASGSTIKRFRIALEGAGANKGDDEYVAIEPDVSMINEDEWVTITVPFSREKPSAEGSNRMKIIFYAGDNVGNSNTFFLDDIRIVEQGTATNLLSTSKLNGSIYPNPCTDVLNVSSADAKSILIYNTAGKLIEKIGKNIEPQTVSVGHLPKGIYIVVLQSHSKQVSRKLQIK